MLTLYTAVGILRFQDSIKEHKTPTVINNRQEYGLTEEEFFLWSSLAFQIRQIHELQSAFSERLKKHHRSENIPIEPYLNRLLLRGLVVKGDGLTGVDALYRLLGELYISPLQDSFSVRLFTCIYLCMKKKLHTKELIHYLKKGTECCIRGFIELRQKLLCILWMDALFYTGYKLCRRNLYFFCYLEYRVLYSSPCRLF